MRKAGEYVSSLLITAAGIWTSETKKYRARLYSPGAKSSSGDKTRVLVTEMDEGAI